MRAADFTDADLSDARLQGVEANDTDFTHANLQDAVLTGANCRGATFTDALLYGTVFSDTRINSQTTFSDPEATFYDSITSRPACVYEEDTSISDELPDGTDTKRYSEDWDPSYALVHTLPDGTDRLDAAAWVYRRLEILHDENALWERARDFDISRGEVEHNQFREENMNSRLAKSEMWMVSKHGESVRRVLYSWAVVIGLCGLLFPFVGGIKEDDGTVHAVGLRSLGELTTVGGWQDILLNVYFSIITFSTIGYGDLSPNGPLSRALVAFESLAGAVLVALLIFVLGRRVAR